MSPLAHWHSMDLSVFFAGTAGSCRLSAAVCPRSWSSRGGDRILVDCGEGTQRQLLRSIGLLELTEIFITHFHADHWLGLPGLLKTFDLRGREAPLAIHGPRGLDDLLAIVMRAAGRVSFELRVIELEPGEVLERDGYRIASVPVAHRGAAFGYVLFEDERPGVVRSAAARRARAHAGPGLRPRAARRDDQRHRAGQVMGRSAPGRKLDDLGRHTALRVAAGRRPRQ